MNQTTDEQVRIFCNEAITEALELRFVELTVGPHSAPGQVMEEEWTVRARLERVDELLLQTYRLKESLKRGSAAAKADYDDAWDTELHRINNSITGRMGDTMSIKDRTAQVNLKLITQKRAQRSADEILSFANEAYYLIKEVHEGLQSTKQDLQSVIRVFQIESSVGGRR